MARVTIIPSDNLVMVDKKPLWFSYTVEPVFHALQWYSDHGEIEWGDRNEDISDFTPYQYLVDEYNAEEVRLADESAQAIADREAAKTYVDHRRDAYNAAGVSLEDLTVAAWEKLVEDRPDSANSLQEIRERVKASHPKE